MSGQRACAVLGGLVIFSACLASQPAHAEGFAVAVEGGYYDMTNARNSAEAIFGGGAGGATFGLFARTGLGRSLFVGAGARMFQKTGERAFAADKDSPAFRLGHPLEMRILPVYALVGYRVAPDAALQPYLGLGVGFTSYREESTVAGEVFEESASKPSFHGVFGLEYGRGTVRFALEGMYMTVPSIIGESGISRVYEEDDVGGFSVVGRIVLVP
ncbi:MAG TPA: outer membrane beta-barrel protein [Vicinamibacteria bacterium]|nr:outer membrane beta-barrel protein [Vicinamibacteria bacterium]